MTDSVLAAGTAGLIYAVTPQLISETRNLNGRAFASLLMTITMLVLLRSVIPSIGPIGQHSPVRTTISVWIVGTLLVGLLYNTHTSTTIALLVSLTTLSFVFGEWRLLAAGVTGLPLAILISGGYYLRVIRNHVDARSLLDAQRALHARTPDRRLTAVRRRRAAARRPARPPARRAVPLEAAAGRARARRKPVHPADGGHPHSPKRLGGAHVLVGGGHRGLVAANHVRRPLRILGPGFHYMKTSVFPTAYVLSVTVNVLEGAISWVGLALIIAMIASFAALAYFYRVMAGRRTEHTAQTPPDLAEAAAYLRTLPGPRALVLPSMYADFVAYAAHKAVVWGGHSGNLDRFEEFYPVLRKPIDYFVETLRGRLPGARPRLHHPGQLKLSDEIQPMTSFGQIGIYAVVQRTKATAGRWQPAVAT